MYFKFELASLVDTSKTLPREPLHFSGKYNVFNWFPPQIVAEVDSTDMVINQWPNAVGVTEINESEFQQKMSENYY